ncbi:MAG: hypothetical protein ACK5V3_16265 [Bdellovibrionales bacterium]
MKTFSQLITFLLLALPLETFSQTVLPSPFLNENIDSTVSSRTEVKFTQKRKNKIETFAEAQLSHGDGKVKLVFDSAKLSPGQYQVLLVASCQNREKKQWVLGTFKTKSGHISTEFIVEHNETKWSFSSEPLNQAQKQEHKQALLIRKIESKKGASKNISCSEFSLISESVVAADGL